MNDLAAWLFWAAVGAYVLLGLLVVGLGYLLATANRRWLGRLEAAEQRHAAAMEASRTRHGAALAKQSRDLVFQLLATRPTEAAQAMSIAGPEGTGGPDGPFPPSEAPPDIMQFVGDIGGDMSEELINLIPPPTIRQTEEEDQ